MPLTYEGIFGSYSNNIFPEERPKTFRIKGEGEKAVSVRIKGGREYEVQIRSCNEAGCSRLIKIKTPYYREFKNRAKELQKKGITISAVYMMFSTWYFIHSPESERFIDYPLMGPYDTEIDIVQWKHIDWANGFGISVFWMDLTWSAPHTMERNLRIMQGFLEKNMSIGIMIGPIDTMRTNKLGAFDLSLPENSDALLSVIRQTLPIMKHPNYYRIQGRPAIFIWAEISFVNRERVYREIRDLVESHTGVPPFIIADILPRIYENWILPTNSNFQGWKNWAIKRDGADRYIDGYTGWIGFFGVHNSSASIPLSEDEFRKNFLKFYKEHLAAWREYSESKGRCFIPTVSPGFIRTGDKGFIKYPIERDVKRFREMTYLALQNIGSCGEIRIDTWNDFYEATFIEPSVNEGFRYIETLLSILTS
ncbi:hypothetical protein [Pyrococcus sp. ST04]|uniref:hypothetical protein n=1 Tax=Pyrococcus sp. ST04 TaxID=1183377 RepID=UPI0002605904|nr:hypothetical protein [Pyrococcus sp. ST04]AFK21685.1 hypothetical protein Py04_0079 [Pyrococcus sp. ST04]